MGLPSKITLHEVGPREGMQFEKGPIATADKVRLIDMISACGLAEIEVTSFVSPKAVPQMADAEQVVAAIQKAPGTRYTGIFLNNEGAERAIATGRLDLEGSVFVQASEAFSIKNTRRGIEETLAATGERLDLYAHHGIPVVNLSVMAAFGCNFSGDVDPRFVASLIERLFAICAERGADPSYIQLADTMGWGNPVSTRRLVGAVRDRWPHKHINLHMHDTRGMALANIVAAMDLGVDDFDSALGGLGGCPFGNFKGAAGNVVTEDIVHLCQELGIETGIDLDLLIAAAQEAETIVGHPLPGKVKQGGRLENYRSRARAAA